MRSDDEVRFLLSGGRLSGKDHDRILGRVLDRSGGGVRPWRLTAAIGLLTSAALALLVLVPWRAHPAGHEQWLAAKGEPGPILRARCPARVEGTCRRGDRLVFETDGTTEGGLLAAYAEGPSGERIWYFPAADGHLATVPAHEGYGVAREIAEIGNEHSVGRYRLHLFLLAKPVDRASLLRGKTSVRASGIGSLDVLP